MRYVYVIGLCEIDLYLSLDYRLQVHSVISYEINLYKLLKITGE